MNLLLQLLLLFRRRGTAIVVALPLSPTNVTFAVRGNALAVADSRTSLSLE